MSRDERDFGVGWRSPRIAQVRAAMRRPAAPARRQVLLWALSGVASGAVIAGAAGAGLALHPEGRRVLDRLSGGDGSDPTPAPAGTLPADIDLASPFDAGLGAGVGQTAGAAGAELPSPFDTSSATTGTTAEVPGAATASDAAAGEPAAVAEGLVAPNAEPSPDEPQPIEPPTRLPIAPDPRDLDPYGSDTPLPAPSLGVPRINPGPAAVVPSGARLLIPSVSVDAQLIPTGLDPEGRMLSPSSPTVIGWFDLGPVPGMLGNAIFSGHLDWHDGTRAVFRNLKSIQPGDEIVYAIDDARVPVRFRALWTRTYLADQAPISEIVGQRPDYSEITLITCSGKFIFDDQNYTHRLVVRGEVV